MKQKTLKVIEETLLWNIQELEVKKDLAKENLAKAILKQDATLEANRQESYNRLVKKLIDTIDAYKDFKNYVKKKDKERK